MFKILVLSISVLLNSIGATHIAGKVEQSYAKPVVTASISPTVLSQLPIPAPLVMFPAGVQPQIQADSWLVRDDATGTVLAEKNGYTKRAPASTIKIMTALLVLEKASLDQVITVPSSAATAPGSSAGLKSGEKFTVSDLMYGLMLNSGNDAAQTFSSVPEWYGGTAGFVQAMNARAGAIGLSNTHISGPDGYDEIGTVSTPHDIAKLLGYVLHQQPKLSQFMLTKDKEVRTVDGKNPRMFNNSDRFVKYDYLGLIGGKTGTGSDRSLGGAGHTMVVAAERGARRYEVYVGGTYSNSPSASYDEARKLLDFTFANVQN